MDSNAASTSELPVHGAQMRAPAFFIVLNRDFEIWPFFLDSSAIKKRPVFFLLISCLTSRFDDFIGDRREACSARWLQATSAGKSSRQEDEEIYTL